MKRIAYKSKKPQLITYERFQPVCHGFFRRVFTNYPEDTIEKIKDIEFTSIGEKEPNRILQTKRNYNRSINNCVITKFAIRENVLYITRDYDKRLPFRKLMCDSHWYNRRKKNRIKKRLRNQEVASLRKYLPTVAHFQALMGDDMEYNVIAYKRIKGTNQYEYATLKSVRNYKVTFFTIEDDGEGYDELLLWVER